MLFRIVACTFPDNLSRNSCRLCGKLGVIITCFRFGKIPPPTSFSLARRFGVFNDVVVSNCYSEQLHC